MIKHFSLFLFSLGIIEIIKYSKVLLLISDSFRIISKIMNLISSKKISNHWKEKAIFKYSLNLLKISFKIFVPFFLIIIYYFIFNLSISNFNNLIFSFLGSLEITIIMIIYIFFRKKIIGKLYFYTKNIT